MGPLNYQLTNLSVQNVLDCSRLNAGCDGGQWDYGFSLVQSEESYPYRAKTGKCWNDESKTAFWATAFYQFNPSEAEVFAGIRRAGPLAAMIDASGPFRHYKSGLYYNEDCNQQSLNHQVLIVGYGVDKTIEDGEYWIVVSSDGANPTSAPVGTFSTLTSLILAIGNAEKLVGLRLGRERIHSDGSKQEQQLWYLHSRGVGLSLLRLKFQADSGSALRN